MLPCGFVCLGSFNALFRLIKGLPCVLFSMFYRLRRWCLAVWLLVCHYICPVAGFLSVPWGFPLVAVFSACMGLIWAVFPFLRVVQPLPFFLCPVGAVVRWYSVRFPVLYMDIGTGTACTFSPCGRLVRRACWG